MTSAAATGEESPAGWNRTRWTTAAWTTLLTLLLLAEGIAFLKKPFTELPLYVRAAERIVRGEQIYVIEAQAYTYPPLFALPFIPMTWLPPQAHRPVWFLVNMAVLGIILWRLARRLGPVLAWPGCSPGSRRVPLWAFWGLVALLSARHVQAPLENQSHDLIIFFCAMLAVDAWCGMRQVGAGLAAALGAALKATPLLFAPLFLWQRRWAALATMLAAIVLTSPLPDVFFPANDGHSWLTTWYRTHLFTIRPGESANCPNSWHSGAQVNQSLAGTLHRLCTYVEPAVDQDDVSVIDLGPTTLKLVILAGQLAVAGWLFWVTRAGLTRNMGDRARQAQRLGEGAALLTAMPLLSPTSLKTHFCVLLVPAAFCLADFLYRRRDLLVGGALLTVGLLGSLTVKGVVGHTVGARFVAYGTVTWCAVALLLATGRILLQRAGLAQAAGSGLPAPTSLEPGAAPAVHRAA